MKKFIIGLVILGSLVGISPAFAQSVPIQVEPPIQNFCRINDRYEPILIVPENIFVKLQHKDFYEVK